MKTWYEGPSTSVNRKILGENFHLQGGSTAQLGKGVDVEKRCDHGELQVCSTLMDERELRQRAHSAARVQSTCAEQFSEHSSYDLERAWLRLDAASHRACRLRR
eukprot:3167290-Pleurochrysis_carterae.AAC.5